ncbi:MAG: hypothetical protein Q9186_000587 [Xanthomendoza sp. 1 TL-2023]
MAQKRKNHPSAPNLSPKRHRHNDDDADAIDHSHQSSKAQVDPTYGQRSAFPGLDSPVAGEDDLFYRPAEDGLEYLRMVRSEAKGVPNLLTAAAAAKSDEEQDLYQDYPLGFYDDGAYTALPPPTAPRKGKVEEDEDVDPQEAYYASLYDQFQAFRALLLHSSPPPVDTASIASASDLVLRLNEGVSLRVWRATLLYTPPTTSLLFHLHQETVIAGIAALEKYISWKTLEKRTFLGAWAWGLLARCREVGMMGSEEVGVVRDLAKKARGMVRALAAGLGGGQGLQGEEVEEEDGDGDGDEEEEGSMVINNGDIKSNDDIPSQASTDEITNGSTAPAATQDSSQDPAIKTQKSTMEMDEMAEAKTRLLATLPQHTSTTTTTNASAQAADNTMTFSNTQPAQSKPPAQQPPLDTSSPQQNDNVNAKSAEKEESMISRTMSMAATLDMIITIVGEGYGQRDLLEGRMVWDIE